MIGPGREVDGFEAQMSLLHDSVGAVATSSGTAALHLALLALGIGVGDEVIVPSYVCTAVLNAVRYVGAGAVLAEIDEESFNIDPTDGKSRMTGRTKAIIAPHIFGNPADIGALNRLGVPVIEDCAQSLGATLGDRLAGSLGEIAVFSFYATKVVTTGEGGMAVARNAALIEKMRDLRDYDERDDYKQRFNYRMSDLAAGTGRRQLQRLPDFIRRRRRLACFYSDGLTGKAVRIPAHVDGSIYYRYVVRTKSVDAYVNALHLLGIQAKRPVYAPLHHYVGGHLPRTDYVHRTALSLPLYPALSDSEAEYVVSAVNSVADRSRVSERASLPLRAALAGTGAG